MRSSPLFSFGLAVLLISCVDTTGLSEKSSRGPRGNPNAAIIVTEFGDLQCPACRAAHKSINLPLVEKYGSQIRFEFKHFPLRSLHRYAMDAAEAAECAADQGKFWEYVDTVYEKQESLNSEALLVWAKDLALDTDLFQRCTESHIKKDTILGDYEEGRSVEVSGTPSYFVNGERVKTGIDEIGAAIDAATSRAMEKL